MMIDMDIYKGKRISWIVAPMLLWLRQKKRQPRLSLKILTTYNSYPLKFLSLKIHFRCKFLAAIWTGDTNHRSF